MRIALISASGPAEPEHGGETQIAASLGRALAGLGHRVTIYGRQQAADTPRSAIIERGVRVERLAAGPACPLSAEQAASHMPKFAASLADRWQARQPDVVHAFSWVSGLAAIGAVRGTGAPVAVTFGSLGAAERRHAGEPVSAARIKLEASIGRTADAVLAWSAAEAAELAALGVPRSAIRVVPCGIDTDVFTPGGRGATRSSRFRLVAFAAGADTAAGIRNLRCAVRALAQLPGSELVIVGGPDGRHLPRSGAFRELARLATALGVRNRVTFAGDIAAAELPPLLRSADLMVSAAAYEPTGLAAVQAMACGTPAVVSAAGAHADAVEDGVTGALVAPEQPAMLAHRVRELLARPALLQGYGMAAADRAKSRYSLDRIGRETAAVYEACRNGVAAAGASGSGGEQAGEAELSESALG